MVVTLHNESVHILLNCRTFFPEEMLLDKKSLFTGLRPQNLKFHHLDPFFHGVNAIQIT